MQTNEDAVISARKNLIVDKDILRLIMVIGFCLLISTIFLLLGTKSSPLYPFNDWVDTNASFTMGKAMMNGRVLYRDIFDQRGPLWFLLYGLAYLISGMTFFGVFLLEVIAFAIFLLFCYKLFLLFLDQKYALISLPLVAGSVVNLRSFAQGGSPEELCLPLITVSLYFLIKYYKEVSPEPAPYRWFLMNGIIAGCVLWIKFSFLGFWIGWLGALLIGLFINKQFLRGIKSLLFFFIGLLIATLPWFVYFVVHHSIGPWINSYFVVNLTGYSDHLSFLERIGFILLNILSHFSFNILSVGLMVIGIYAFLKNQKYIGGFVHRIGFLCCIFLLILSVYGGGRGYIYYFLIFAPFVVFGFIILLNSHFEIFGEIRSDKFVINVCLLSLIGLISYTYQANQNAYMLQIEKDDLVQYKFAQIINQHDNPTLLNYGWLDGGFYTAAGIIPNIRFFQKQNIEYSRYPLNVDEQNRYIKEQMVDFVVVAIPAAIYSDSTGIPNLEEAYELIAIETQTTENIDFCFSLYRRHNLE